MQERMILVEDVEDVRYAEESLTSRGSRGRVIASHRPANVTYRRVPVDRGSSSTARTAWDGGRLTCHESTRVRRLCPSVVRLLRAALALAKVTVSSWETGSPTIS
jgi:hypothetical protein